MSNERMTDSCSFFKLRCPPPPRAAVPGSPSDRRTLSAALHSPGHLLQTQARLSCPRTDALIGPPAGFTQHMARDRLLKYLGNRGLSLNSVF